MFLYFSCHFLISAICQSWERSHDHDQRESIGSTEWNDDSWSLHEFRIKLGNKMKKDNWIGKEGRVISCNDSIDKIEVYPTGSSFIQIKLAPQKKLPRLFLLFSVAYSYFVWQKERRRWSLPCRLLVCGSTLWVAPSWVELLKQLKTSIALYILSQDRRQSFRRFDGSHNFLTFNRRLNQLKKWCF